MAAIQQIVLPEVEQEGHAIAKRAVTILGATGSVGLSTLDIIRQSPEAYAVECLTAHRNVDQLIAAALEFKPKLAVIGDAKQYHRLREALAGTGIEVAAGDAALVEAAGRPVDWVMAAIVGAAGLRPTFAAAGAARVLALANKECLVSAGAVFLRAVAGGSCKLLPVDSEHSAVFQAIDPDAHDKIERMVLTASGGPFRTWSREEIAAAQPQAALRHPNWSMGQKITIDSATLMNKGLELIEALHLFEMAPAQLDVIVHPQSIVHCLIEYADGSVLAHMSAPDMRIPIAYSLSWPGRMHTPLPRLDLTKIASLEFEAPDEARFPALRLARESMEAGGAACTVLNAANEIAVEAYLAKRLSFYGITDVVSDTLEMASGKGYLRSLSSLEDVLEADQHGRTLARSLLGNPR